MLGWALPSVSRATLRSRTLGKVSVRITHEAKSTACRCICSRQSPVCVDNLRSSRPPSGTSGTTRRTSKVSILPLEVVQRIASGEVICGYESVLQELVENAIDAQSTKVVVNIDILSRSITVEDNGTGISVSDGLLDIAKCNATTKLRSLQQLRDGITTLGFRGQGLWSIANTAKLLTISSRPTDSVCGTTVSFARDGEPHMESVTDIAMNTGTIARAIDLPWDLESKEKRRMIRDCKEWLTRAALCHPQISFYLYKNGSSYWNSVINLAQPQKQRVRCLAAQFQSSTSDFRTASVSIANIGNLSLVVGLPSAIHSSSRAWVLTAVNGRCVNLDWIRRTICEAIQVPQSRYPVAFLHLKVDPEHVNWNISPKKTVIDFKNASIKTSVNEACRVLIRDCLRASVMSNNDEASVIDESVIQPRNQAVPAKVGHFLQILHEGKEARDRALGKESQNLGALNAKVVGQVLNTYILVEYNGGILLIEQHIADERSIYERLLRIWDESRFDAPKEDTFLPSSTKEEHIFSLTSLGIIIDSCSEDNGRATEFKVKAVPALLAPLPSSQLVSLLLRLGAEAQTLEDAAASLSCQLAVRNGKTLSTAQMTKIARELLKCDNPHTCPHGRPIFVDLQVQELAKLFGRTWIPERCTNESMGSDGLLLSTRSSRIWKGVLQE